MPVPDRASHLHPPPNHFERVAGRLRHQSRKAAGDQFGPVSQNGRGGRVFRVGGGGVGSQGWKAEPIARGVVREKGHSGVREHAGKGGGEAAVEVYEPASRGGKSRYGVAQRGGSHGGGGDACGLFVVDLLADAGEGGPGFVLGFECQTHPYHLEWVRQHHARDSGECAAEETAQRGFILLGRDEEGTELLVGEEFDGGVGENAEQGCGMPPEEPAHAVGLVDVPHCGHNAEPGAGVFRELRVGGLEQDFDPVKRTDEGFGLIFDTVVRGGKCGLRGGWGA